MVFEPLFQLVIFKERAGVISKAPVWICLGSGPYMYTAPTLLKLIYVVITQWKSDKNLVG